MVPNDTPTGQADRPEVLSNKLPLRLAWYLI